MTRTLPKVDKRRADFAELREAYGVFANILQEGGMLEKRGKSFTVTRLPRSEGVVFERKIKGLEEALSALLSGLGEKKAIDGQEEVVLSVIARPAEIDEAYIFDICALRVRARGPILDALIANTGENDWQKKLRDFADWDSIAGIICAADGNNQRAAIGSVLTLAAIGRGGIKMIEMEVPQEVDESTHLVRGAEWMKAGLPRFSSAASEALWYLIRARSLHSRMFKERKQGFYTAMALVAFTASGLSFDRVSEKTGLPLSLVKKLGEPGLCKEMAPRDRDFIEREVYGSRKADLEDGRIRCAAERIWRGPAIYLRGMDWRLEVSFKAREMLARGDDLVEVADRLRIQRRELVRILSQALSDGKDERTRFKNAIPKPQAFRRLFDS